MAKFRVDIFAWIPQPDVKNPLFDLRGIADLGPGACGPRFGGDNFVIPPPVGTAWNGLTYRATQRIEFNFSKFGDQPVLSLDTGVVTGMTTVLTETRVRGGKICHSMRARVKDSPPASVSWSVDDKWYELRFSGAAQDPLPASAAGRVVGARTEKLAGAVVPPLSWSVCLRLQQGFDLGILTNARYAFSSAISLDCSPKIFPQQSAAGDGSNLAHGTIEVTRFPSYILYLTGYGATGIPKTAVLYFSDASNRGLQQIIVAQTDVLRNVSW